MRGNWAKHPSEMNSYIEIKFKKEIGGGSGGSFDLKLQTIVSVFLCRKQFR